MTAVLPQPVLSALRTPAAAVDRQRRRWPDVAIIMGLVMITTIVLLVNLHGYPTVQDDEGTYLSQAEWVRAHGALSPYTYWYDHPPFGWIQLAALSWIPAFHGGSLTVSSGRAIMLLYADASAALLYLLARRLDIRRPFAVLAVLLFVCSPISVTFLRQVYLDNLAIPWLIAAFYFACTPRQHLWHYVLAGVFLAVTVLTKETTAILVPAVALAGWQSSYARTRDFASVGFWSGFVLICLVYPLMALLKNELFAGPIRVSLQAAMEFQFVKRSGSGSVFDPVASAHATALGWVQLDRWLLILGALSALFALTIRRLRPIGLVVVLLGITLLRKGYLPQMFIIVALPFLALCVGGVVDQAWSTTRRWGKPARLIGDGSLLAAFTVGIVALGAAWQPGLARAFTSSNNTEHVAAVAYLRTSAIPRDSRIVVDNTMWQDVYHAGFSSPWHTIWYYKVDLDSAAKKELPDGWRDLDYIILTPFMRQDISTLGLTTMGIAVEHSRVVARFGTGPAAVELRAVTK
ncbi:glycosyltransferase family 39 protein [Frankia sp. Cj3]|uniref:ArnT family glycosyltransferase n=3 Tax=Frankia TaxID=1854 RepID=UPI001EF6F02A|nr:glycosyltransferase family 39 protein [Frankia sp. Cj3]